jgi:hypothetical protein
VKLKLVCEPNRITNFTNSKSELLYGEVDETELKLVKLSSPKQVLTCHVFKSLSRTESLENRYIDLGD